jgi:hypothetical protein
VVLGEGKRKLERVMNDRESPSSFPLDHSVAFVSSFEALWLFSIYKRPFKTGRAVRMGGLQTKIWQYPLDGCSGKSNELIEKGVEAPRASGAGKGHSAGACVWSCAIVSFVGARIPWRTERGARRNIGLCACNVMHAAEAHVRVSALI